MRQKKQILYWLLPLMGTAFALWYVKNATADVVYSCLLYTSRCV